MAKYVLTGATGHLGNVVTRKLAQQGRAILALLLPNESLVSIENLPVEVAYGDVRDAQFLRAHIAPGDVVIHMAGIIDVSSKKNEALMDVNVNGTRNVADVCAEKGARLVYTSTVHIIPPLKGAVLKEPTVLDENKVVGAYAKSKTIATRYILEKCKQGLDACVVYPSGIIGPYDYKTSNVGQVIWEHMNGRLLAYVKGGYNFVDVRDVADGIIAACEKGRAGEGYVLSGSCCSVLSLIRTINEKIGRKREPPQIALWFAYAMAPLSELYYKARRQKPSFSAYSLHTLQDNANFSHDKAAAALNFSPRPVKQSIFDAVQWFLDQKPAPRLCAK